MAPDGKAALRSQAVPGRAEIGSWGFDLSGMDRSVSAGDNFFLYANGAWLRDAVIPPDKSVLDTFAKLEELSTQRTRVILEDAARTPGSKIGDFYASFMDRSAVDELGLAPIAPLLGRIDRAATAAERAGLVGELTRMNVNVPFATWVDSDDKNPDVAIAYFYQSGLGLPERQYYLGGDPELVEKRAAYVRYLTNFLQLSGASDAQSRARAVMEFETKIARAHWPQVETRDPDKGYNKLSPDKLKEAAPNFDWDAYLQSAGYAGEREFIVNQPSAIAGAAELLESAPPDVLKDYLKVRAMDSYAPYLSKPFVDSHFDFHGRALGGVGENEPEWKRGANLVSRLMGEEVGKIYVERHFPPEAKAAADRLVRNVLAAWDRRIGALSWMAPETRTRAREKLARLIPEIGYPVRWRDYSSLKVRRDDLFGNVVRANQFEHRRNLDRLGKPIDKREWYTQLPPMAVNGYANHKWNQIVFSAGVLQPPFFDPHADPAVNYGAIGAVIAHEIGHHFDDQGSKYDSGGVLREWWTAEDVERFGALTRKLVDQFNRYEIFPGKFVNGELTVGDNIGDLAGVTVAYDAYKASEEGRDVPLIDGFTGDQRFFLGWAQVWRSAFRKEALMQRLLTDLHAPPEQRVWIVRNVDGWYDAFDVRPGQRLYLSPEQRVRIW